MINGHSSVLGSGPSSGEEEKITPLDLPPMVPHYIFSSFLIVHKFNMCIFFGGQVNIDYRL